MGQEQKWVDDEGDAVVEQLDGGRTDVATVVMVRSFDGIKT